MSQPAYASYASNHYAPDPYAHDNGYSPNHPNSYSSYSKGDTAIAHPSPKPLQESFVDTTIPSLPSGAGYAENMDSQRLSNTFQTHHDGRYSYALAPAPASPSPRGAIHSDFATYPQAHIDEPVEIVTEKRRWREKQREQGVSGVLDSFRTRNQVAYLVTVAIQGAIVLTMISIVFAKINANIIQRTAQQRSISVYLAIYIFGAIFEIFAAIDALRLKNTIQLVGIIIFNLAIMVYGTLVGSQVKKVLRPTGESTCGEDVDGNITGSDPNLTCFAILKLYDEVHKFIVVIPCVTAAGSVVLAYLSWRLFAEFGWDVYRRIGADIQLKRMYFYYQIYVCLLKFDIFFFGGFTIQYLILVLSESSKNAEFVITIVALPVTLALIVIAALAVRLEIRWLTYFIFLFEILGLAYFIYKLFRLYDAGQPYEYSRKTLATFSVLSIIVLLLTIVASVVCFLNFDRGLKDQIPPYFPSLNPLKQKKKSEEKEEPNRSRTSLD